MTISNTYRWNGKLGSDWDGSTGGPNPQSNWDLLDGSGTTPEIPAGAGDLAVFDLGGAINVTTKNGVASAEEWQVASSSTVTLSSGHYEAGADPLLGGMLIDEDSALIITSSATMADQGSLDIVGLTGNGTLTLQSGAGFDDHGMIVGADAAAHGVVEASAPFGFIIAQSGSGGTLDGLLVVGEDGDGTVDISDTPIFGSAFAIIGENADSHGVVDLSNVTWGGSTLTIGPAGDGVANIGQGSTVAMVSTVVGPNGTLNVTGTGVVLGAVTLEFGTIDVTGGGEVLLGGDTGDAGAVTVGGLGLTALGTVKGEVDLAGGAVDATGAAPGSLLIDGNVHGTGTLAPLMTMEVNGGIDAGVEIVFSPSIGAQVGDLVLDVAGGDLGTIVAFGAGNTIDVQGSLYSSALFTQGTSGEAGTLVLSGGTAAPLSLAVLGDYAPDAFTATPGSTDTIVTVVPCFAAGTRILTAAGEVAVEALRVGALAPVGSGALRRVRWIGRTCVSGDNAAAPVLVRADAFAPGAPVRAVALSPDHAVCVEGALVPARLLVNGTSIVRAQRQSVVYYHVELERHDLLVAAGLAAESYLDTGNRAQLSNAGIASRSG